MVVFLLNLFLLWKLQPSSGVFVCILFQHIHDYMLIVFGDLFVGREDSNDRDLLCIRCSADHHCRASYSSLQRSVSPFHIISYTVLEQTIHNSEAR